LLKNSEYFYVLLFYGLEILSKIFGKSWNVFLNNIDILKPKIIHKVHYLLFVFFYFISIFDIFFFPISPNQTCQKI